jgi:hypothetical protein
VLTVDPAVSIDLCPEQVGWLVGGDELRIVGRTAIGRATVIALHLSDDPDVLEVRTYWVLAGWHPPEAR